MSRKEKHWILAFFTMIAVLAIGIILTLPPDPAAGAALPQEAATPVQNFGPSIPEATSSSNAAVSTVVTPAQGKIAILFGVNAYCSAGTGQLTVKDGSTTIWSTPSGAVGTTNFTEAWPVGLVASRGDALTVQLGTCGSMNTGTLDVEASTY